MARVTTGATQSTRRSTQTVQCKCVLVRMNLFS